MDYLDKLIVKNYLDMEILGLKFLIINFFQRLNRVSAGNAPAVKNTRSGASCRNIPAILEPLEVEAGCLATTDALTHWNFFI